MKAIPGINSRLLLLGVLPAALIGLALAAYFVQARFADLDQHLNERSKRITHEMAAASASFIAVGNRVALQHLVEAIALEDDIVEASIFDRQGNILASAQSYPLAGSTDNNNHLLRTASILPDASLGHADPSPLGSTRLVLSRNGTLRRQIETLLFSLVALMGGLAMSAILARRIARKISEPVVTLTLAVHELSKGNMDARAEIDPKSVAELAYLQAGFNAMAAELQKNRESLEWQVRQATARLQDALDALEKRNQELESARGLAEAQTELKSRFLAQVSHEIRTPMNGIIGFAELLENTSLSADQAEKLGLISRSAKNLLAIINDILDLSKLEAGKVSLNPHPFALRPCLEDIVCLLSSRVNQPPIALWISPDVPQTVVGDPVRLQQVAANLLGNAIKFTREGKIVMRVRRHAEPQRILFSVSDSGNGISPQDLAKLFSPFLQLEKYAVNTEKGSGLGLSIAKNIVESMGGKIRLASRLGKGTSLWFHLPLPEVEPMAPPTRLGQVAFVEPDRILRQMIADQLHGLGAEVAAFDDADTLLEYFADKPAPQAALYGFWPRRENADADLPRWLEWCASQQIKPAVLFPCRERRLVGFYRKRGVICLFHPLRSVALAKACTGTETTSLPPIDLKLGLPSPARRGIRLLIADDNDINRLLLHAQLEHLEAHIVEAENGKEALERLRLHRFDLVFLDLQMPMMDGSQVLRELRASPGPNRYAPVIAITAYCANEQREAILQEGFAACLIKPILQEELTELVNSWLDTQNKQGALETSHRAEDYASAILRKTNGNRELAGIITHKLSAELPETLRQVEIATAKRERENARRIVHSLNGAAGFAGLESLRQAAAHLETALGQGKDWEALEESCQGLGREIAHFLSLETAILDSIAQISNEAGNL